MPQYTSLAIRELDSFIYGTSPHPVTLKNGLVIGGGTVYPELNFTLPDMLVDASSMAEVRKQYTQMITEASKRAVELNAPGLVVEFELLPDLTLVPEWGAEVTKIIKDTLNEVQAAHGLKTALRVTPNDIREFNRPPVQRSGEFVENMYRSFQLCAAAGADFLCYVTPAEHLGLPTARDVWDGVMASRIAAHAADIVKGVPGAREWDDRLSAARKHFDWETVTELALDPGRVRQVRGERATRDPEACSMCGKFCSMKVQAALLAD